MTRHTTRAVFGTGAVLLTGALVLTGCGSGFAGDDTKADAEGLTSSDDALTVLIGSSGDAETAAVQSAVDAWSADSGTKVTVQVASNLDQELSQGFAAGDPADLFYLSTDQASGYAANGSLEAYGDQLANKDDFYPSLVENFTVDGTFYCAPKDFSTLSLIINTQMWTEAGLTDADLPKTWDDLAAVAQKLTTAEHVGLAFGAEYQRVGVFMAQAGGGLVSDGTVIADDAANVEALEYVKSHLVDGTFAYAKDVGAGWGGEALGKQSAAMVIEGNWITGALSNDYSTLEYTVAELPEGAGGKGTLQFTNCWGMAADSPNQQAALDLVEYLTSADSQLAFSKAFGPMPSIKSAAEDWTSANPTLEAFLAGADYAQFPPNQAGTADVIADFNSQLESLKTTDPKTILDAVQSNLEAVVE
ncbi:MULTISPECIES: sugar ABC transporter substrate-binding protein [Microbacterium]|uniref:Extracellular solute-binding protein n=1 Tax=Microbacterium maritypicum TaxID=33918 RepID=A0AAJ5VBT7_MICMQ|nr:MULTISPECIES: extracellular solute-binding protein [Microbacterium]EYT57680.1 sugar ABC transporter substrate-binding protein [Microbacterium sp. UCD-TDU]WEF21313.1 extracellular solute-binding protein [Microbacterium liquefaciens]